MRREKEVEGTKGGGRGERGEGGKEDRGEGEREGERKGEGGWGGIRV